MSFFKRLQQTLTLGGFRRKRDDFYDQMARSWENKEPLRDFLEAELKIARDPKTKNASRAAALKIIRNRLQSGGQNRYSQLLATVMPQGDRLMLTALDDATDKAKLMRKIANSVRQQRLLLSMVKKKVLPPLMILPGAFIFAYVMATKSIPVIVDVAPPEVWDTFNMSVRRFAEYLAHHSGKSIAVVVALIALLVYQLPRWTGPMRARFEAFSPSAATMLFPVAPWILPLSIYRDVQAGLMFSALAVMLQSGRTLNDAMKAIAQNSSPWMRWQVRKILNHLETRPTEYQKAFAKGLVSPSLLARLSSQIRTNPRFDEVLISLGETAGVEIREEVDKQTSKINFMLLAAGGALVVFMMAGNLAISTKMGEEMSPQKQMMKKMKAQEASRHR